MDRGSGRVMTCRPKGREKKWLFPFYHDKQCLIKEWIWDVVSGNVLGLGLSSGNISNEAGQKVYFSYFGCPIKRIFYQEMSSFTYHFDVMNFFLLGVKQQVFHMQLK